MFPEDVDKILPDDVPLTDTAMSPDVTLIEYWTVSVFSLIMSEVGSDTTPIKGR